MTLEELRKLREAKQQAMQKRDTNGKDVQIIVGMGTCGIAAGAKVVLMNSLTSWTKSTSLM